MADNTFTRIATRIHDDFIKSGRTVAGERLPSVRDLQVKYAVSRSTVWHALGVLETQGLVIKKQGSGCYVSSGTLHKAPDSRKLIGIVGDSNIGGMLCYQAQKGVEWFCERNGYQLIVASTNNNYETEQQQVAKMVESGCAGIVLLVAPRTKENSRTDFLKKQYREFPIVLVDLANPDQNRTSVVFDNYQAGYEMTELLIEHGHKRIAFMISPGSYILRSNEDRFQGFQDAMKFAGNRVYDEDIFPVWLYTQPAVLEEQFLSILRNWQEAAEKWTAMVALHDGMAMKMISMAEAMEIRIPEEMVITGFDDYIYSRAFRPSFPTTSPDFYQAGKIAARLLANQIATGNLCKETYILPVPIKNQGI